MYICLFLAIGERCIWLPSVFYRQSGNLFLHQTPGRPTQNTTGQGVRTVTLEWVGASNQDDEFKVLLVVAGLVGRPHTWNSYIFSDLRGVEIFPLYLLKEASAIDM